MGDDATGTETWDKACGGSNLRPRRMGARHDAIRPAGATSRCTTAARRGRLPFVGRCMQCALWPTTHGAGHADKRAERASGPRIRLQRFGYEAELDREVVAVDSCLQALDMAADVPGGFLISALAAVATWAQAIAHEGRRNNLPAGCGYGALGWIGTARREAVALSEPRANRVSHQVGARLALKQVAVEGGVCS